MITTMLDRRGGFIGDFKKKYTDYFLLKDKLQFLLKMHNFLDLKGLQHAIVLQCVKFNASSTALIIIFDQCKPLIFKDHKKN